MKKLILVFLVAALFAGMAGAGGLDTHFGLGYMAQYFGDYSELNTNLTTDTSWMPYGVSAYGGIGYGFGAKQVVSIGFEPSVGMGVNLHDTNMIANLILQGRGYLKFKPANAFTIAGFGGFSYDLYGAIKDGAEITADKFAPMAGGRLTLLFLYAQYDVTFYPDDLPLRHSFGAGIAFKK
jgi:hypothetical protein